MKKQHTQIDTVTALIEQIEASRDRNLRDTRLKISVGANNNFRFILRYFMPYTITQLKSGNLLFLNRGYKPIGLAYETCTPLVDYEEYENISFVGEINNDFYFYSDGCKPWENRKNLNDYLDKINSFLQGLKND